MSRSRSRLFVSIALVVTAGCAAAQQQQHPAPPTADEVISIVTRAVQQELLPSVRRLESRVESVDNRLALLDSRVAELATHIARGEQSQQLADLLSRLEGRLTRLTKAVAQSSGQGSRYGGAAAPEDRQGAQLVGPGAGDTPDPAPSAGGAFSQTASRRPAAEQESPAERRQFRDCSDLPPDSKSGRYLLLQGAGVQQPPSVGFCDMDTAGGNWTVLQRRDAAQLGQDFNLGWKDYKDGFGYLLTEFWWGLDKVWRLTSAHDRQYELRVDLEDFNGTQAYALYQNFRISSEADGFRLHISEYTGTAGDSLSASAGQRFSTGDRDQDAWPSGSCAAEHQGCWWYTSCGLTSLHGRHDERGAAGPTGIWWFTFSQWSSLRSTEMKIRPT